MLLYDSIISQSYTMTFVTDTNINITKIKPDSAPENSSSERKKTAASVVAANRICLFLQAEHCPRGICNQNTKQNKSHRAVNQPVQEHLSPISTQSFYRLIIIFLLTLGSSSSSVWLLSWEMYRAVFVLSPLALFTACNHTNDFSRLLKVTIKRGRTENLKVMNTINGY